MSLFSVIKKLLGFSSKPLSLQPGDKMLVCEDCHSNFVFDAGEQAFFRSKGFTEPKRCPRCRKKVRSRMRRRGRGGHGGGGGGNGGGQSQNHQQHSQPNQQHHNDRNRGRHHGRRHSVIDGDSPYADER